MIAVDFVEIEIETGPTGNLNEADAGSFTAFRHITLERFLVEGFQSIAIETLDVLKTNLETGCVLFRDQVAAGDEILVFRPTVRTP